MRTLLISKHKNMYLPPHKRVYKKYNEHFKALEELATELTFPNPFLLEQSVAAGNFWDRDFECYGWPEPSIALNKPLITKYWQKRDELDAILKADEPFTKYLKSTKSYANNEGLEAFYWVSYFSIKHKIYAIDYT